MAKTTKPSGNAAPKAAAAPPRKAGPGIQSGKTKRKLASVRVAELLGDVAGAAFRRQGFAQLEIIARWPVIVGPLLARYSAPERIAFPQGEQSGGTLYIRTDGAFALELQHSEPLVVERINSYYGFPAVARLAIRQGPLPLNRARKIFQARPLTVAEQSALTQSLTATDEKLRQALENLGATILGDGPAEPHPPDLNRAARSKSRPAHH